MSDLIKTSSDGGMMSIPRHELKICDTLSRYNQLRSFKLDAIDILEWKDTIVKLVPDLELDALEFVIDKMITGELEHDRDKGIQNIFRGLKKIEKTDTGYKILKAIW